MFEECFNIFNKRGLVFGKKRLMVVHFIPDLCDFAESLLYMWSKQPAVCETSRGFWEALSTCPGNLRVQRSLTNNHLPHREFIYRF
jgi:hypothetical protein